MSAFVNWLSSSREALQQFGWWGMLAFALAIVVAQALIAPISPVSLAAGAIFGLGRGWVAVTLGTAFGAALNFLVARYAARAAIAQRLEKSEKFRLIDAAVGREGWKVVALLRFVPIPFGLANYAYGLTAIPFWPYLAATVLAIMPANTLFIYLGHTAQVSMAAALGEARPRHPAEYALLGIGLLAGICALAYITKLARTALAQADVVAEPAFVASEKHSAE